MMGHPRLAGPPLPRRSTPAAIAAGLLAAAALLAPVPAAAVQVTTGTGSGLAGQTVDITLSTTSLSGLGVTSIQFDLSYNASIVTATDVLETGTATGAAGWNNPTFNVTSGRISVSDAGTTALSGSGPLIKVRFVINPAQLTATSTTLTLSNFVFNEGAPNDTTGNGSITVNATPIITVSPNTGEVVRGQTLQFSVSGSVTPPVTWSTSDPLIATINASGLLTGVAPGAVRVHALDNAGRSDDSDGDILIRGMGLTAGSATVVQGQTATVPITVTSLNGLGIRAGQVTLSYNAALATATGVTTPAGTLLHDYGPVGFGTSSGTCTLDFAGSADLTGSGTLCVVTFSTSTQASGSTALTVASALFNETLPAKTTNGSLTVSALPSITVSPETVTLLAGQTRQFSVSGSPTLPIAWSTLDPAVATVDASGLLTAVAGGVTKVRAVDAVGAADENASVTVYDFQVSLPTITAPAGASLRVPIFVDRDVSALGIYSLQYSLLFNGAWVTEVRSLRSGLISVWDASQIVANPTSGKLAVAAGGSQTLGSGSSELHVLELTLSPSVPYGTDIPLTLSGFLCNEGLPWAQVANGLIRVRNTVDVPPGAARGFALEPAAPNPVRAATRIRFAIPEAGGAGERVALAVYGVDGRRVRALVDAPLGAGEHDATWDGCDAVGAPAPAGVYFCRLEWKGRVLSRRLALVR